jgi:hypothetical protein
MDRGRSDFGPLLISTSTEERRDDFTRQLSLLHYMALLDIDGSRLQRQGGKSGECILINPQ